MMESLEAVEQKVNQVFIDIFKFHAERLTEKEKMKSLLASSIGFMLIDLMILYLELEKELNITFSEKNVIEERFDIYNNIIRFVQEKI